MKTLEDIKADVKAGGKDEACLAALCEFIAANPGSDDAYLTRGMLHWRMGHRAEAINDLNAALRINPQSQAATMLSSINTILDFYDKDRYNP